MCYHAQKITECYNSHNIPIAHYSKSTKIRKKKIIYEKKNAPHTRKIAIETFSRVKRAWFTLIGNLPPNSLKKTIVKMLDILLKPTRKK